ncbi:MAG: hypothetical protein ACM3KL_01365 [Alphaproteobacteria bacterium]
MNLIERPLVFVALLLAGCGTTRDVAVSSYHVTRDVAVGSYRVATAPVHYALRRRSNEPTMVGTTDAVESDVTTPGHPASVTQTTSTPQRRPKSDVAQTQSPPKKAPHVQTEVTQSEPKPAPPPQTSVASFPTAKAVPDKPGYVFSPFDSSGRYVDVSGYASGTKVKDPWTDKIFVVP